MFTDDVPGTKSSVIGDFLTRGNVRTLLVMQYSTYSISASQKRRPPVTCPLTAVDTVQIPSARSNQCNGAQKPALHRKSPVKGPHCSTATTMGDKHDTKFSWPCSCHSGKGDVRWCSQYLQYQTIYNIRFEIVAILMITELGLPWCGICGC